MTIELIYSGVPSTNTITNTQKFTNGKAIYLLAPDITDEVEIDFYLQLEISNSDNRLVTLNEEFRADTVRIFTIPEQYQDTNLELYGAFTNTLNIALEIYVILADVSLQIIADDLQEVINGIDNIAEDTTTEETIKLILQVITTIARGNPLPALPSGLGALSGAGQNVALWGGVFNE
jgi:hypothetical protein